MLGTSPASGIRYSSKEPGSAWPSASWRICSISVTPMPIAIPPRIWPFSERGFTTVPTSCTAR